jgi:hypothetical protein
MADGRGAQLAIAGLCTAVFTIALAALVTSQLALMSVLDSTRAERAADRIAESRFTAELVEQTVQQAIEPVAGAEVAAQLATATSNDPMVQSVVATALVSAHRQVVDADVTAADRADGNASVNAAIVQSAIGAATEAGIDVGTIEAGDGTLGGIGLDTVAAQAGLPSVVPDDLPALGLRQVAETTRVIALLSLIAFGLAAVFAHPEPARSLRSLGAAMAVVCGAWLAGLLVAGWAIRRTTDTLFGEMIEDVWSDAAGSMLLLVGAGLVIGLGVWFAGAAWLGFSRGATARRA